MYWLRLPVLNLKLGTKFLTLTVYYWVEKERSKIEMESYPKQPDLDEELKEIIADMEDAGELVRVRSLPLPAHQSQELSESPQQHPVPEDPRWSNW